MSAVSAQPVRWSNRVLVGVALAAWGVPTLAWWTSVGNPLDYFTFSVPTGQRIYLASKLVGLYAITAAWLQLTYGVLGPDGRRRLGIEYGNAPHRLFGWTVLAAAFAHAAAFILGVTLRTGHLATQFMTVSFGHGFYRSMISLGLIAFVALVLAALAAALRIRLHAWRLLHWLALPAFMLALVHSWQIGSEARISPLTFLYATMALTIAGAMMMRGRARAVVDKQ